MEEKKNAFVDVKPEVAPVSCFGCKTCTMCITDRPSECKTRTKLQSK